MTAPIVIDAALPPCNASSTGAANSGANFAEVLADVQTGKTTHRAADGDNRTAKQMVSASDEGAKQESATSTEVVIPLNSIVVPEAPVPLPTPVPELQATVEVKQVPAAQTEISAGLGVLTNSAPSPSQTLDTKLSLATPLKSMANEEPASTAQLIATAVDNKILGTVPANHEPGAQLVVPKTPEFPSSSHPILSEKVELSVEAQAEGPQMAVTAGEAVTADVPPAPSPDIACQLIPEAKATLNATLALEDATATEQAAECPQPAGETKDKPLSIRSDNSTMSSVALDQYESPPPPPDRPLQALLPSVPMPERTAQGLADSTDHSNRGKEISTRKSSREPVPPAVVSSPPVASSQTGSFAGDLAITENRPTPAPVDPTVFTNHLRPAHETRSQQTLSPTPKLMPDGVMTEPLALGTVHAAKLIQRLGESEIHVGLRTLIFGSVEVHTLVRGSQVGLSIGAEKGDLHSWLTPELGALSATIRQHDLKLEAVHFFDPSSSLNADDFSGMRQDPQSFQHPRFSMPETDAEAPAPEIAEIIASASMGTGLSVHA